METKDFYAILGVPKNASDDEIKKKYRELCIKYHPDRQVGKSEAEQKEASDKMQEINEAWATLKDPQKRKEYDAMGSNPFAGFTGGSTNLEDVLREFAERESAFQDLWGGGSSNRTHKKVAKGSDVKIRIECTLDEVCDGVTKKIKYKTYNSVKCPNCGGSGMVTEVSQNSLFGAQVFRHPCPNCGGSGYVADTSNQDEEKVISVKIPQIARNGYVEIYEGEGNKAPNGVGQNGDLYIMYAIKDDPRFVMSNNGLDLYTRVDVPILDCITGCSVEISLVNGKKKKVEIPAGTKHDDSIVLDGYGMPNGNGYYGNLIVKVAQIYPTEALSKDTMKIIGKLKKCNEFKK